MYFFNGEGGKGASASLDGKRSPSMDIRNIEEIANALIACMVEIGGRREGCGKGSGPPASEALRQILLRLWY